MNFSKHRLWFFVGLTEATCVNVIGYMGISELIAFLVAPIWLFKDANTLRKDGFMPIVILALMVVVGSLTSSLYNGIDFARAARGFGATYGVFAGLIFFHHLLRKDLAGVKWYLIGVALSAIITIFAFRGGAEASKAMEKGAEAVQSGPLFIMSHFGGLATLPLFSFYLQSPTWLTAVCFIYPSVQTVLTSATGRSAVMMTLMTLFLVIYADRKPARIKKIKKYFPVVMGIGFLVILLFSQVYKSAAKSGLLNEDAKAKYEDQEGKYGKGGLLGTIMSGRAEFFVGLMAACDKPIAGFGPWPTDDNHYWEQFVAKYGNMEDLETYVRLRAYHERMGRKILLPVHSAIVGYWVYYGILGLPFWIYVFIKLLQLFRYHIDAVPPWFGYFAFTVPNNLWNILFSPPGNRMGAAFFISLVLFAILVGKKKFPLPAEMQNEIAKASGKSRMRRQIG